MKYNDKVTLTKDGGKIIKKGMTGTIKQVNRFKCNVHIDDLNKVYSVKKECLKVNGLKEKAKKALKSKKKKEHENKQIKPKENKANGLFGLFGNDE